MDKKIWSRVDHVYVSRVSVYNMEVDAECSFPLLWMLLRCVQQRRSGVSRWGHHCHCASPTLPSHSQFGRYNVQLLVLALCAAFNSCDGNVDATSPWHALKNLPAAPIACNMFMLKTLSRAFFTDLTELILSFLFATTDYKEYKF